MQTAIYTSREVSLECLSSSLGSISELRCGYEVVLCPHILPKSCSRVKADALSQDLFESCD